MENFEAIADRTLAGKFSQRGGSVAHTEPVQRGHTERFVEVIKNDFEIRDGWLVPKASGQRRLRIRLMPTLRPGDVARHKLDKQRRRWAGQLHQPITFDAELKVVE